MTRQVRLKIHDPDEVIDRMEFDHGEDYDGHINILEGELPPRMPQFTYEVVNE